MNRRSDNHHNSAAFAGFERPTSNYFHMPNEWIDICADISNLAELKVVQYVLRHTWGFREYGIQKHITVDEFIRGRKRRDGGRLDRGTGLAEQSVRNGLESAKRHGLIEEFIDGSDKARIKKYYSLRMRGTASPITVTTDAERQPDGHHHDVGSEVQTLDPEVNDLDPRGPTSRPRSEKNTEDEIFEESSDSAAAPSIDDAPSQPARSSLKVAVAVTEISQTFRDESHLGSNKAQAMNLFIASGLTEDHFVREMFEAAAVTRDEINRRRVAGADPIRNRMAYYFSVVRKQLNLPSGERGGGQ